MNFKPMLLVKKNPENKVVIKYSKSNACVLYLLTAKTQLETSNWYKQKTFESSKQQESALNCPKSI